MSNNRQTCNDSHGIPNLWFGCGQLFPSSHTTSLINVTQMKSYTSGSCSMWVDPYTAPAPGGGVTCGTCDNSLPYCGPLNDSYIRPASGATSSFYPSTLQHNNFSPGAATSSYCFGALGWKRVWGSKVLQGILGYTSRQWGAADSFDWCGACSYHTVDAAADGTRYLRLDAVANYSFTQSTWTVTRTYNGQYGCSDASPSAPCSPCGDPSCGCLDDYCQAWTGPTINSIYGGNATNTIIINKYGDTTTATCVSSSGATNPTDAAVASANAYDELLLTNYNVSSLLSIYNGWISDGIGAWGSPLPADIVGSGNTWTVTFRSIHNCYDKCGNNNPTNDPIYVVSITPTSVELYIYQNRVDGAYPHCDSDGNCRPTIQIQHEIYKFTSSTTFSYTKDTYDPVGNIDTYHHWDCLGTLSSPYTSTDQDNDIIAALAYWDLGDDSLYPWRQDTNYTLGPLVCYDESPAGNVPIAPTCITTSLYTGQVLGKPAPAGVDRYYDINHPNYCSTDTGGGCYTFQIDSYGDWSTSCGVPRATKWLDYYQANNMPDCAFVGNGYTEFSANNCIQAVSIEPTKKWMCKSAETIFTKQSYNFMRPCGIDRFETSQSRCISSVVGNVINISGTGPVAPYTAGDIVYICGTTSNDGIWTASVVTPYAITISGQLMTSASISGSSIIAGCDGIISKLRWQNPFQPSICGTLNIANANNSNPVTCSFVDPIYFIDGDVVNISGASGLTIINGIKTIKTIDSSHVGLVGVSGISQPAYTGGGIMSSSYKDLSWNTVQPYGTFTYKTFGIDFRNPAEYYRFSASIVVNNGSTTCDGVSYCAGVALPANPRINQVACGYEQQLYTNICHEACLPFYPCGVSVAYFSPNVESFNPTSSINCAWPTITTDTQYGALYMMPLDQAMKEPLYIPPAEPCSFGTDPYLEDDYSCESDSGGNHYFAGRNRYEALCSTGSAPALPSGIYLGCVDPNSITTASVCPPGNYCQPPVIPSTFPLGSTCAPYVVYPYQTNISDYINALTCVQSSGRFASTYAKNLI